MSDRAILLTCIASAIAAYGTVAIDLPAWTAALLAAAAAAEFALRSRRNVRAATERVEHELQRTLRWREEQLANTAHELRTPLTAVATALELLREGVASTEDERAQFLDQATAASRHMAFLIHDVVDLAAIEGNRIRLQMRECRIRDLLLDVKKVMELPAQTHGVTLAIDDVDDRIAVYADDRIPSRRRARLGLLVLIAVVGATANDDRAFARDDSERLAGSKRVRCVRRRRLGMMRACSAPHSH